MALATIERLPQDVLELICERIRSNDAHAAVHCQRIGYIRSLFEFALASAHFFAPAVHAAVHFNPSGYSHFAWPRVHDRLAYIDMRSCFDDVGDYYVLTKETDSKSMVEIILPARNHNRVRIARPPLFSNKNHRVDQFPVQSSNYWSRLPISCAQLRHFNVLDAMAWPPVPPLCRYLWLEDSQHSFSTLTCPWPVCPPTLECLKLTNFSMGIGDNVRYLPLHLSSLTFVVNDFVRAECLPSLYRNLPCTLAVLKLIVESTDAWIFHDSCVSELAAGLATLQALVVFEHGFLHAKDVPSVLKGLASRGEGDVMCMKSLTFNVILPSEDEVEWNTVWTLGAQWEEVCTVANALLEIERLKFESVRLEGAWEDMKVSVACSVLCFLPIPTRSLDARLVLWCPKCVQKVMNWLGASSTLTDLRMSSPGRTLVGVGVDPHAEAHLNPGRVYLATDVTEGFAFFENDNKLDLISTWTFPTSLTSINVSGCNLMDQDLQYLAQQWPRGLKHLNFTCNNITTVALPLPSLLHTLNVAHNPLGTALKPMVWINGLPRSLRWLNVKKCGLSAHVLETLSQVAMRSRKTQSGSPKLVVVGGED